MLCRTRMANVTDVDDQIQQTLSLNVTAQGASEEAELGDDRSAGPIDLDDSCRALQREKLDKMYGFRLPSGSEPAEAAEAPPLPIPSSSEGMQGWLREVGSDRDRSTDAFPPELDLEIENDIARKDRAKIPYSSVHLLSSIHDPELGWEAPVMTDCQAQSIFRQDDMRAGALLHEKPNSASDGSGADADRPARPELPKTTSRGEVTLQVYNFASWTRRSGLPIFHLGVEVYQEEHFYSVGGIDFCEPRGYSSMVHHESVPMGRTSLNRVAVFRVLRDMRQEWLPGEYALVGRNCQDFAVAFCRALGVHESMPAECCRFSNMNEMVPPAVISGIREADRRFTLLQSLLDEWNPKHLGRRFCGRHKPCYSCRPESVADENGPSLGSVPFGTDAIVRL